MASIQFTELYYITGSNPLLKLSKAAMIPFSSVTFTTFKAFFKKSTEMLTDTCTGQIVKQLVGQKHFTCNVHLSKKHSMC